MALKDRYRIDELTWQQLWRHFTLQLIWYPLTFIVLAGFAWAVLDDLSWTPAIALLWLIPYLLTILLSQLWLVRSKFTMLVTFLMMLSLEMFFLIASDVCVYSFWSIPGLWIQNILVCIAGIILSRYYYLYWDQVWSSHETHNENVSLDLENGRYDFANRFVMSEDIVKHKKTKKYSNPALIGIAFTVAPIGVAIPLIFSKFGDHSIPLIVAWILSIPLILGWLKMVMAPFYLFRKLSSYEKKIGKPIINGLLTEKRK